LPNGGSLSAAGGVYFGNQGQQAPWGQFIYKPPNFPLIFTAGTPNCQNLPGSLHPSGQQSFPGFWIGGGINF
jgi:hypothetical protein